MADLNANTNLEKNHENPSFAYDTISRLFDEQNEGFEQGNDSSSQAKEFIQEKPKRILGASDERKNENQKKAAGDKEESYADQKSNVERPEENDKKITDSESLLKEESEKLQKELESTKKWGHTNSRKLKKAILTTKEFVESGDISEEEGQRLLEILESSGASTQDEDADFIDDKQASPFSKIFRVANTELENIRKYTGDNQLEDKVKAFDYFLSVASVQEQEEILEDFNELIDHPIELTKKMLAIGKKCYEESYRDIQEAGGFKGYIEKKRSEIDKLSKTIDKLTKKLLQYEDYDHPTHSLAEMGSSEDGKASSGDSVDNLFESRDRVAANRR